MPLDDIFSRPNPLDDIPTTKRRPRNQFDSPQPEMIAPHVYTFNALLNLGSKKYSTRHDEALRNRRQDALAMRRDAFIAALHQERTFPTAGRPWQIRVPNPKDARQAKVAQRVTAALRMVPDFDLFRLYMMEAVWFGRYGSQVRWEEMDTDDGKLWTIGEHQPVHGDKIQYDWDRTPCVAINPLLAMKFPEMEVNFTNNGDNGMTLLKLSNDKYRRQFVFHRHLTLDADYFEAEMAGQINGTGLRNQVYWAWWMRDEMLSWAVDFMQKVGTLGLLIFGYEEHNADAKLAAEDAAKEASNQVALTMPMVAGMATKQANMVQHIPANNAGIDALRSMIADYWERHIERLYVGQPSSGSTAGNGFGGSAGAGLHADTKFQLLKFDAGNLDATITRDIVCRLLELNEGGPVGFPVWFESSVSNPEDAAKLQAASTMYQMGVRLKEDEVRALAGFSKPDLETDDILDYRAEQQKQAKLKATQAGAGISQDKKPGDKGKEAGQGVTTNAKAKQDTGGFAKPAAYADDGSVFAEYVEKDGGARAYTFGALPFDNRAWGGVAGTVAGCRLRECQFTLPGLVAVEGYSDAERILAYDIISLVAGKSPASWPAVSPEAAAEMARAVLAGK